MGFAFSVDNSRFLFENFWQFGIARVYETVAFGEMQILLIKSEICHLSCEHNIETSDRVRYWSVEIVQFFSIVTNFSVQPCGTKVFSIQIHLSSWYLRATAFLILFCKMVTLRSSFNLWLLRKIFPSSLLSGLFLMP